MSPSSGLVLLHFLSFVSQHQRRLLCPPPPAFSPYISFCLSTSVHFLSLVSQHRLLFRLLRPPALSRLFHFICFPACPPWFPFTCLCLLCRPLQSSPLISFPPSGLVFLHLHRLPCPVTLSLSSFISFSLSFQYRLLCPLLPVLSLFHFFSLVPSHLVCRSPSLGFCSWHVFRSGSFLHKSKCVCPFVFFVRWLWASIIVCGRLGAVCHSGRIETK